MLVTTIATNLLKPKRWAVAFSKLRSRFGRRNSKYEASKAVQWCSDQASSMDEFLKKLDCDLYDETMEFSKQLKEKSDRKLRKLEFEMGGGGSAELLYFLTRLCKPMFCVETGVAAGHSSTAILSALRKNEKGMLFSSDLPYFRIDDPENYIGILVEEELMDRWVLTTDGDEKNLSHLPKQFNEIDLLHYDSDKYYEGRERVFNHLHSMLSHGSSVIMDDIQDNLFFMDYVSKIGKEYKVFQYERKYIGIIMNENNHP